jgi:hypothetical protein
MHLPTLPTFFVKDGQERKAYHSVEAKELVADGWTEKGAKPVSKAATEKMAAPKTSSAKVKEEAPTEKKGEDK